MPNILVHLFTPVPCCKVVLAVLALHYLLVDCLFFNVVNYYTTPATCKLCARSLPLWLLWALNTAVANIIDTILYNKRVLMLTEKLWSA